MYKKEYKAVWTCKYTFLSNFIKNILNINYVMITTVIANLRRIIFKD